MQFIIQTLQQSHTFGCVGMKDYRVLESTDFKQVFSQNSFQISIYGKVSRFSTMW